MTQQPTSRISQRRSAALAEGSSEYSTKRAQLLRAAATVFRDKGYASTTLNDVAKVFGTDRASLYYYVGSKEELFQECISNVLQENSEKAEAISKSGDRPRDRLISLITLLISSQQEHYPYLFVYVQEDMERVASAEALWATEMVESTHRFERYFIETIAEGIKSGDFRNDLSPALIANSLFGMTQWTHRWWVPGEKYSVQDLVDTFVGVFFSGIDSKEA